MRRTQEQQPLRTSDHNNIVINVFSIILALVPLLISTSIMLQGIITKAQIGIQDEGYLVGWVLASVLFLFVVLFLRYFLMYKKIDDNTIESIAVPSVIIGILVVIVLFAFAFSNGIVNNARLKLLEDNGYHNVMNVQDFRNKFNLEPKSEPGSITKFYAQISGAKDNEWVEIGLNQSNEKLFISYEISIDLDTSNIAKQIK